MISEVLFEMISVWSFHTASQFKWVCVKKKIILLFGDSNFKWLYRASCHFPKKKRDGYTYFWSCLCSLWNRIRVKTCFHWKKKVRNSRTFWKVLHHVCVPALHRLVTTAICEMMMIVNCDGLFPGRETYRRRSYVRSFIKLRHDLNKKKRNGG